MDASLSATDARLIERIREVDAQVVAAARDLKVLSKLAWPSQLRDEFLVRLHAGTPALPVPPPIEPFPAELLEVLRRLDVPIAEHPLAYFVARTAQSYADVADMLGAAGTPRFTTLSKLVYGSPEESLQPGVMSSLDAARRIVASTRALVRAVPETDEDPTLDAPTVAGHMQQAMDDFFGPGVVGVSLDPDLAAKAAAGASTIRLRASAEFTRNDLDQLVQHEAFVHAATLRNGRRQPVLGCLGLGAPRTTETQEGLATFAELITSTIDLNRLSRLALRIVAIHHALEGADFLDVFQFFRGHGQSERESYQSTARVFRGGDPRGRVAFTKDAVYLRGLIGTYAFFHTALAALKVEYPRFMFAGRLTWGDVVDLEPMFEAGIIEAPAHVPPWAAGAERLAAFVAFSNLAHLLPLPSARLDDF